MSEDWTGRLLAGVERDPVLEVGVWEKYLAEHAAAVPVTDPAEQDALRREFGYLRPRMRS